MREGIRKEENTTIFRFMSGLNLEIRDKVKLLPYQDLNNLSYFDLNKMFSMLLHIYSS